MTARESHDPAPALGLFDQIVQHERGVASPSAGHLRPRLPYLFEDPIGGGEDPFAVEQFIEAPPPRRASTQLAAFQTPANLPGPSEPSILPAMPVIAEEAGGPPISQDTHREPFEPKREASAVRSEVAIIEHNTQHLVVERSAPGTRPETPTAPFEAAQASRSSRQIAPRGPSPAARAAFQNIRSDERGGDSPEQVVEIHIGRIDVRAPARSFEPVLHPEPRPSPSHHLDHYLGRRSRGARS